MTPDLLRFDEATIDTTLGYSNIGDAFQHFVHDIAQDDYPDLHCFRTKGKDGGIDLVRTASGCRTVFSCKHVGKDGLAAAKADWKKAEGELRRNIATAGGPPKRQGQYAPWYDVDCPIRAYHFWLSSELPNEQNRATLRQEIHKFFADMSAQHPHLGHLKGLTIVVHDWPDCRAALNRLPHVSFRWFPSTRPNGLVPLDVGQRSGTFHEYLNSGKLPHYSRATHLASFPAPPGVEVPDEEALLRQLEQGRDAGIIISGAGGVGKTRLMLEIGRVALGRGWLALRVARHLERDALETLAKRLTPNTKVLLLVDYLETQPDFDAVVQYVEELNETCEFHIRYVATCRSSYYARTSYSLPSHYHVEVSSSRDSAAQEWYAGYLHETVIHILNSSGIDVAQEHLETCRDVPILAVFIAYLHSAGKKAELDELLNERDFGKWLAKRLQLSFGETEVSRELAQLVAMFPLPAASVSQVLVGNTQVLFNNLAQDRWIELSPAGDIWETIHDVLADQILLAHLTATPHTAKQFVEELLVLAAQVDCLTSALLTLQRIADHAPLSTLDWSAILNEQLAANPTAWRAVRDTLIHLSVLQPLQHIRLLARHQAVWEEAERDTDFQNKIGWFARWMTREGTEEVGAEDRETVVGWLTSCVPHVTTSNFVLNWALRLSPEQFRDSALGWIADHPRLFQTHYLLVAWLESDLPADSVAAHVQDWMSAFPTIPHLSFVYRAWLDAEGDKDLVRDGIQRWLKEHSAEPEAGFVYQAWLDAQGDKELVREGIEAWLKEHSTEPEAGFVYQAWLDAQGDFSVIKEGAILWLRQHWQLQEATFLIKPLVRQSDLPADTVCDILNWCRAFPTDEDVFWRFCKLGNHLFRAEVAESVCSTAEAIIGPYLEPARLGEMTRQHIVQVVSFLIAAPGLRSGELRDRVDSLFVKWLRRPGSFGADLRAHTTTQRRSYVQRVCDLVVSGSLDVRKDADGLRRFLQWVGTWDPEWKANVVNIIDYLARQYPADGLWDTFD